MAIAGREDGEFGRRFVGGRAGGGERICGGEAKVGDFTGGSGGVVETIGGCVRGSWVGALWFQGREVDGCG